MAEHSNQVSNQVSNQASNQASNQGAGAGAKSGWFKLGKHWPWLIVGMLVVHASIILGTILIVNARHDLYVESDYYAKSIDWDNQRAINENADKMGWGILLDAQMPGQDAKQTPSGSRMMSVTLTDRNGDPIDGALVEIESYHPAHANDRTNIVLIGAGEGVYRRDLVMGTPGIWHAIISLRYQGVQARVTRKIKIEGV